MENKVMEGINEEMICEEVTKSSKNTIFKLGVGAVALAAVGYGVYKLCKKVKNRKNQIEYVETEYEVEENEK